MFPGPIQPVALQTFATTARRWKLPPIRTGRVQPAERGLVAQRDWVLRPLGPNREGSHGRPVRLERDCLVGVPAVLDPGLVRAGLCE